MKAASRLLYFQRITAYETACRRPFVDELLPETFRNRRVASAPAATINRQEPFVRCHPHTRRRTSRRKSSGDPAYVCLRSFANAAHAIVPLRLLRSGAPRIRVDPV